MVISVLYYSFEAVCCTCALWLERPVSTTIIKMAAFSGYLAFFQAFLLATAAQVPVAKRWAIDITRTIM